MPETATYIFSGGGTGGHLFPGIAVAEELRSRNRVTRILFAGSERGIENKIVAEHQLEHHCLSTQPLSTLARHPLRFLRRNRRAYQSAKQLLRQENPQAVVGLGGFTSVPLVLAASSLGIPVILLEQNVVPGRATRWLSRRASLVCLSFPEAAFSLPKNVPTYVTGNPVRAEIRELYGQPDDNRRFTQPTLLVLGGSQGASAVNDAVVSAVSQLRERFSGWRIVHQTGSEQCEQVRRQYETQNIVAEIQPFFSDLAGRYAHATIAISRAGATTLAELACSGTPAVLIPYPNSVGDHQLLNARACESAGAARVVEQQTDSASTADKLVIQLFGLLNDPGALQQIRQAMRMMAKPNAAQKVANLLEEFRERRQVA